MLSLNKFGRRRKRRGMTLVELMIAVAIFGTVMILMTALLIEVLQRQKGNNTTLRLLYNSANLHRQLRVVAASGAAIDVEEDQADSDGDGIRGLVRFVNEDLARVAEIRFVDEDGDLNTIEDNSIIYVPDISASEESGRIVISYVSPIILGGTQQPVFTRQDGNPDPLIVQFRAGDRPAPPQPTLRAESLTGPSDDAITGQGNQSIIFRGAYAPRNI